MKGYRKIIRVKKCIYLLSRDLYTREKRWNIQREKGIDREKISLRNREKKRVIWREKRYAEKRKAKEN